jgi:glutaredoxin
MRLNGEMYMYSKPDCIWCDRAEALLKQAGYQVIKMDITVDWSAREWFKDNGFKTVPQVYTERSEYIGGYEDVKSWLEI